MWLPWLSTPDLNIIVLLEFYLSLALNKRRVRLFFISKRLSNLLMQVVVEFGNDHESQRIGQNNIFIIFETGEKPLIKLLFVCDILLLI